MSRARILADYVSSGDELALKAPIAGPTFTGTVGGLGTPVINLGSATGAIPAGVTGGAGLTGSTSLGTVTAGNLSNQDIVMPRIKEMDRFHYNSQTSDADANDDNINISGTESCGPFIAEDNDDIFVFGWAMNIWCGAGYMGWGIHKDTADGGPSGSESVVYRKARHHMGQFGITTAASTAGGTDTMKYANGDGGWSCTATTAGTTVGVEYWFRMIGATGGSTTDCRWGHTGAAGAQNGHGVHMWVQRWSEV